MSERGAQSEVTYVEAIRLALEDAMREDDSIVLLGQDISAGFPFGATRGLAELYGSERVRDTPISEAASIGCAVGAAMTGTRTVVEIDFAGFLLLGLDQLVNNAAKLRYMSGGQLRVPLLVRAGQGPLGAFAAQHSQSQHAWLASVPGLALCAPADAQDAYDLMRWGLRQGDPVVFAEDMRLYRTKGPLRREDGAAARAAGDESKRYGRAPEHGAGGELAGQGAGGGLAGQGAGGGLAGHGAGGELDVPRARVLCRGRDATVLCFGFGTTLALSAARELAAEGVELEIVDLRLLSPLDREAIDESARHTGRVLCLGDDPLLGGITATLAAVADAQAHGALAAPVARLAARHWPTPFGAGERLVYPSAESVAAAVRRLVAWPDAAGRDGAEIANGDFELAAP